MVRLASLRQRNGSITDFIMILVTLDMIRDRLRSRRSTQQIMTTEVCDPITHVIPNLRNTILEYRRAHED